MPWSGWFVIALSVILGGWLMFDGARALIVGDYMTPQTGEYAGQLGPWAKLISAVGLDPRSITVRTIHVVLGLAWLVSMGCFAARCAWAWWALAVCSVGSLWYFPVGTVIAALQLLLLLSSSLRNGFHG